MIVGVKWVNGSTDIYYNIDSINKEGQNIVLVSNSGKDVSLWAEKVESIEIGGIND